MFGFLKDKLKQAVGKFSKDVEKEAVVEKKEVLVESTPIITEKVAAPVEEKKGFFKKLFGKKDAEEIIEEKEELLEVLEQAVPVDEKPIVKDVPKPIIKPEVKVEKPTIHEVKVEKIEKPEVKTEKPIIKEAKIELPQTEVKIEKPVVKEVKIEKPVIKEVKVERPISHELPKTEVKIERATVKDVKIEKPVVHEIKIEKPVVESKPIVQAPKVQPIEEHKEEKKGFFTKITETFTKFNISEEKFEELFWELEVVMLENNVAVEVIEKIKLDMKKELMSGKINRKGVEELILSTLKKSIIELFDIDTIDLMKQIKNKKNKPYIIAVIGVNGSGKTTSIAKLTHMMQKQGLSVVLAASDTFRAAAIQQLEEHANRLNTKLIKHDYNSDPAAVAFDAIKYAEAKNIDVVLIDTAGRLHSNTNLMKELEKVIRVCKPDIKIFVGESITGNDCVEQAKEFDKIAGIDAIILAKADIDEKGGAAISVSYVTKKPILYLGTGQTYDDLKVFDSNTIIESLEL